MSNPAEHYPRDLVGYGRIPPDPRWPGGAVISVQFVVNYEEGGENCILHGDPASESFLSEIVGATPWPAMRHPGMESIYEFGSRVGFWRLHRLFTEASMPVTVYAIATAIARNREAVAGMREAGWEIASHGLKWIDYRDVPRAEEAAHMAEAIRIHTEVAGERPLGFYQGRTSPNTLSIVMEEGGFLYSADSYADELPYWIEGPAGPQLIVPYTLDANDMRFATPQGFNSGDQFFAYLRDSFETLYAEGMAGSPRLLSIGLHCRLVGRPGRTAALARFLDHVRSRPRVWVARRLDIARHWIAHHPPMGGYRPSRMPRGLFVERFGDVFEKTPTIAEVAHRRGLSSNADTAEGLAATMIGAMQELSPEAKLALVKAHPNLSGRLAMVGALSEEAGKEQRSAGLDRLTPDELTRVRALDDAYTSRLGFPFIMAVVGRSKEEIIAAFERRLGNDTDAELVEALGQIETMARMRIAAKFASEQ